VSYSGGGKCRTEDSETPEVIYEREGSLVHSVNYHLVPRRVAICRTHCFRRREDF